MGFIKEIKELVGFNTEEEDYDEEGLNNLIKQVTQN